MTRNTSGNVGIGVAAERRSMQDGDWKNDTRKTKLTVSIDKDPSHLQIIEELSGGTKWTVDLAASAEFTETLFRIEHGLPFTPKFLCYFKCTDAPIALAGNIGQYQQTYATMLTNSFPIGEEWLEAGTDETYFYIIHRVSSTLALSSGDYTFYGSDYKFRVRFEILNIPVL